MLVRFLLGLMLILGAMPMGAPCHAAVARDAQAMPGCHEGAAPASDARRDPRRASPDHGCIGCAALADWLAERVAIPIAPRAVAAMAWPSRLALYATAPPMLRPPRIG